jgi:RHS repeat-associated protein
MVHQIDGLKRTNSFAYDSLGRRTVHTMPGGQAEMFGYDAAGNLLLQTNFNGVVITNQYDALNRLTNRTSVNGYEASFAYSATGLRTNMTDLSGTTRYSYDSRDRLQFKTVSWSGGPTISLNYGFDANANLTNLWSSTAGGVTNFYQHDALNRLTNLVANGSAAAGYGFDPAGNLQTLRYGNGVTNLLQYDNLNRLTNAVWNLNAGSLASFYYQLGQSGNRTNLSETVDITSRNYAWSYNPVSRLKQETVSGGSPAGTLSYGLDLVGNRTNRTSTLSGLTNQSFTFNTNDWLNSDSYDSNGSTTSSSGIASQYDPLDHLTNYNSGAVLLTYDGDGNRVRKTVGSTTTLYVWDDRNPSGYSQVVEEWTGSGGTTNLSNVYNYGLQLISQRQPSASTNYFLFDGHGSTRVLTDSGGGVANALAFDAHGNLIASNAAPQTVYLYAGQQLDSDLNLYYLRARYHNPNTGRFWTRDSYEGSQEDPIGLHKYLYCADNPVNRIDPSGHDAIDILGAAAIGAGIGGFSSAVASHAIGQAITVRSVVEGAALGAVLGPGALVPSVATGLGIGGVLVGASYLPVLTDPNSSVSQKIAAVTLFLSAAYGADQGFRYANAANQARPLVPESYMNPKLVVDMRKAPGGQRTAKGHPRNGPWFWNEMLRDNPDLFSEANRALIHQKRSPFIDETWLNHFPQHSSFNRQKLVHHHIDQGPIATPLPENIHQAWSSDLHPNE